MNEDFGNPMMIDTELQVRLMNLVIGEASDFERDQLQLLMEDRAELASYYQHLEHLHGLLCEVGTGEPSFVAETSDEEDAWQLSPERRSKVLTVLDGKAQASGEKVELASSTNTKRKIFSSQRWIATIAVTAASLLLGLMIFPRLATKRIANSIVLDDRNIRDTIASMDADGDYIIGAAGTSPTNGVETQSEIMGGTDLKYVLPLQRSRVEENTPVDSPSSRSRNSELLPGYVSPSAPQSSPAPASSPAPTPATIGLADGLARLSRAGDKDRFDQVADSKSESSFKDHNTMSDDFKQESFGFGEVIDKVRQWDQKEFWGTNRLDTKAEDLSQEGVTSSLSFAGRTDTAPQSGEASASDRFGFQVLSKENSQSPALPNQPSFGDVQSNFALSVDSPKPEMNLWGQSENPTTPAPVAPEPVAAMIKSGAGQLQIGQAAQNGTVLSGGIATASPALGLTQPNIYFDSSESGLMQTVTPRIIVPDEEDERVATVASRVPQRAELNESSPPVAYPNEERWRELALRRSKNSGTVDLGVEVDGTKEGQAADVTKGFAESSKRHTTQLGDAEVQFGGPPVFAKGSKSDVELALKAAEKAMEQQQVGVVSTEDYVDVKKSREWMSVQTASPEIAADGRRLVESEAAVAGKLANSKPSEPELASPVPAKREKKTAVAIDETSAAQEAFSTFSLHVSDVSFKLAQTALSQGQWPDASKIRIEEFVNALDYRDPLPCGKEKVACRVEQAIHPFLMQRNMLRVSMRTAATGRSQNTPLRLTVLLDNSGSMERPDRRQAVLRAFQTLGAQLKATDQITLISFASTPRLLADKVTGNQSETLLQIIENLPSEGGTNIESALVLAGEKAIEQQLAGAQNRIVLLTDGAVNLGDANPDSLAKLVTQLRDSGIAFDAAGISSHDLNDEVLEALTRQGDGRYYLLDSAQSADESFASQIAGALRPSAKNVKVQVEFNPQRVGRYKLLGFEKHRLDKEDFRNDAVDAAEMAAAEAGVAVYQYEIKPHGTGDVGSVSVRFRDVSSGEMIEHRWPIPYESNTSRLEQAESSMQLAACAALFAAKLGGGPLADSVDLGALQKLLSSLPDQVASQSRVQQLRAMVEQAIEVGR